MNKETLTFNKKTASWGVLLVSILLIMSSVLAETWTFNDTGITGSSSGNLFNFTNKYVSLTNASFDDNISLNGLLLNDTHNGYNDGLIRNSNGNYYPATGANIQNAIDDCTSGGTVWVPAGTFNITSPIEPKNNTKLFGSGIGATVIQCDGSYSDPTSYGMIKISGAKKLHNITLTDFTLDGNYTNTGYTGHGISIYGSSGIGAKDVTITNVYIRRTEANGITASGSSSTYYPERLKLSDITIVDSQEHGLGLAGNDHTISDITIINSAKKDGFYGIDTAATHSTIKGVVIRNLIYGIKVTSSHNCTISDINIVDIWNGTGTGIKITSSENIELNSVVINGKTNASGKTKFGLEIASTSNNINVNSFRARHGSDSGLSIYGDNCNFNNIDVSNFDSFGIYHRGDDCNYNNIQTKGNTNNGMQIILCDRTNVVNIVSESNNNGIGLVGANDVSITNVNINSNSADGIDTDTATNYSIVNGKIISNVKGIDIHSADSNLSISNVLIRSNSNDGIECDAIDSVIIKNCIMWNDPFDDNIVGSNKNVAEADNIGMNTV